MKHCGAVNQSQAISVCSRYSAELFEFMLKLTRIKKMNTYFTATNCTSKIKIAFGGMVGGAPRVP